MARTPRNYAHNLQLSSSDTVVLSAVASGVQSQVSKLSFYNSSASDNRLVTINVVESGGSPATGNILKTKSIPPQESWNVLEILTEVFTQGMSLQAKQDVGTDVNVNCSGADFS